ncbi:MAG: hypothetical protein EPO08_11835 [Rhodospirillaceae bacterium]|nr:MAG: hypothetical protein EPO08_11835 [Rhodospirillaceae bacterium]
MRSGPPKKANAPAAAPNPPPAVKPAPAAPPDAKPDTPPAGAKALPGEANEPLTGEADNAEGSGLPIPRFVSLRTDPINMRSGPGLRYPVDWVYRRRHLPVEVIAEFDTWRQIRDPDGTTGWVHQSMITGHRTGLVRGTAQALHRSDGDEGNPVATLEAGVIVNIQRCPVGSQSCRVEVNGLQGWLKRDQIWGVYPTETVE